MHPLAHAILVTWRRNGGYAERLVADLAPEHWTAQPFHGRVMNHPAWVLSHLCVYTPICTALLRGEPFDDPIDHTYGQKSEVVSDPNEYDPPGELIKSYAVLHLDAERALSQVRDEVLLAATPLERWRAIHPHTGDMLVTLMVKHESGHLGQLSAWRRAMGLPRVAM